MSSFTIRYMMMTAVVTFIFPYTSLMVLVFVLWLECKGLGLDNIMWLKDMKSTDIVTYLISLMYSSNGSTNNKDVRESEPLHQLQPPQYHQYNYQQHQQIPMYKVTTV